jgi:hypothetical protein
MKKYKLIVKSEQLQPVLLVCVALFVLMGLMIKPLSAQINSQKKFIFISGQLTSSNTGAPIPDHEIYISSDSLINGGFGYFGITKTDVNGFYRDTLVTATTDGLINLYLFDFDNNKILLDRYYRFVWENEYLMFADFAIFDPDANTELQANFSPQGNTQQNPLKVIFKDQSIGESIKSWFWEFGDGTTSTVQDPEHTYDQPGIYLVNLTINAMPPEFQGYQSSTITKQVQVGLREFHHLGGHVFAQQFPIDLGLAYLYTFDEFNNIVPLDTTQIDQLGYYYFYSVPAGKYFTKARLQPTAALYGQYMPTYYRNAYDWNDAAEIIVESSDNWECDIWLRPSPGIEQGNGRIIGQISFDTSLVNRTPVPAEDIEILLLNLQGTFLTCGLSDGNGQFNFGSIPYGTYQIFPDVTGISTTPMYVTISEENPEQNDVNLVIFPNEITFGVNENISAFVGSTMLLYPNPVHDQARISLEMKKSSRLNILVTDLAGRLVVNQEYQLSPGSQEIILNVGKLPAGVYQVTLLPEDKIMISGKFLKSN